MKSPALKWLLLPALILCLPACQPVEPWERGDLAKPQMALDPNAMHSALRAHTFASREAASATTSAAGGGCGCD
jgi:hypothetical protein